MIQADIMLTFLTAARLCINLNNIQRVADSYIHHTRKAIRIHTRVTPIGYNQFVRIHITRTER